MIEGSTDIHIIQAIPASGATDTGLPTQAEQNCVFSTAVGAQTGAAVCTVLLEAAGEMQTMVQTITGNVIEVQVAATMTGGGGSPSTPTATGSGSSTDAVRATSTSGTASASMQTQTGKGNGAMKMSLTAFSALGLVPSLVNVLLL